jgi:hypothetical protein
MISVASSISIPMSNTNKTMYDSLKSHINSLELKTHKVVTSEGATLYLAFKRDNIDPVGYNDSLNHIRYCCDHLNHIRYCSENSSILCNLCAKGFIHDYAPLVFNNKKTLLGSLPRDSPILLHIQSLDSCFSTIFGTYVVIDGPIGTKHFGGFEHLYVELPNCYLKKFTVDDYNWFINQHYPTIRRLIKENDNDGIIESLKLLQSLLPKITYGDNIQQSTEWFLKYMMEYRSVDSDFERDMVIMKALLNQYMLPGHGSERIVATNLKQTKDTVLEAMSCAHNESALVKLLTNLFNQTTTTIVDGCAFPIEEKWMENYKLLEGLHQTPLSLSYITEHGCRLGAWCNVQRTDKSENKLSEEKIQLLEQIPGWYWDVEEKWMENYKLLEALNETPPLTYITECGFRVGAWCDAQRTNKNENKLSEEKIQLLEQIPGWYWNVEEKLTNLF